MTIGVALLAERPRDAAARQKGAKAIVLVADKQITWSGDDFKSDVEVEKYRGLPGKWGFLFAGAPNTAEDVSEEARRIGPRSFRTALGTRQAMKSAYQAVRSRAYEDQVLGPLRAPGAFLQGSRQEISGLIQYELLRNHWQFADDFASVLLVAGFDELGRGQIFEVRDPGKLDRDYMACFRVIGAPEDVIRTRLIEWHARHSDALEVALRNALRAKFHAELAASVGSGTDAWIFTRRNAARMPVKVPEWIVLALRSEYINNDDLPLYTIEPGQILDKEIAPLRGNWRARVSRWVRGVAR